MFIDYITLLLINMAAGLTLLAAYVFKGLDDTDQRKWVPGFGIAGAVALVFGTHMTMTWPVIGPYNSAFGEMSVLFGVIFLGAAIALAKDWSLLTVAAYAFFAGAAAIVLGFRIIDIPLTKMPVPSGIGFILSGLGGVFAAPTLVYLRGNRAFRVLAAVVLVAAAAIWAFTGYMAYWGHMVQFESWLPITMSPAGG